MIFYTYVYKDPETNIPRYVGKGKDRRSKFHLYPSQVRNKAFNGWLNNLKAKGLKPVIEMLAIGIEEELAFLVEVEAIDLYGRLDLKTGSLFNHTNGGEGQSGRVYKCSKETAAKISKANKGKSGYWKGKVGPTKGRLTSNETKLKISLAKTGKPNLGYNKVS